MRPFQRSNSLPPRHRIPRPFSLTAALACTLIAATPALVACADDRAPRTVAAAPKMSSSAAVAYVGTTLRVDGADYPRPAGVRECGPHVCVPGPSNSTLTIAKGALLVGVRPGSESAARARLTALGLSIQRELSGGRTLLIAVPALFEAQWLAALSKEPSLEYVEYDGVVTTQNR